MDTLHAGHRSRLREQYYAAQGDGFPDHLLLELLLSYAIPRKDVNPLAHRLLEEFGSLEHVLGATQAELSSIDGIGMQTSVLLQLVFQLHQRMERSAILQGAKTVRLINTDQLGRYALSIGAHDRYETVRLLCFDSALRLIHSCVLAVGSKDEVQMEPRHVIEKAFFHMAASFALTHNHPTGEVLPSKDDIETNRRLTLLSKELDLPLNDNLILGDRCVYSFRFDRVYQFPSADETRSLSLGEYIDELVALDAAAKQRLRDRIREQA